MNKKLIEQFNKPDTHLVISGYPLRNGEGNNYGISWYTKETIEPIAKKKNARFVVLAETNHNNEPKCYQDGKILVLRVFDQRHLSLYPRILTWLSTFNNVKNVYVHSEFGANGGIKNFMFLVPFLLLIKLTGRNVTFFAHNFVESFDTIAGHLNFKKGSIKINVLNTLVKLYNKSLGIVVDRFVVMDEAIKTRAEKYINAAKLTSIPIFVRKPLKKVSQEQARKELGIPKDDFVLLYFGFVTMYKGADWIIDEVRKLKNIPINGKKIRLIVAGGEAYSLKDKKHYIEFYKKQLAIAARHENITITGFVPEDRIDSYFQAANVAVFPYRGLIGASGALTYALSNHTPFIMSSDLSPMLNDPNVQTLLTKSEITSKEVRFKLTTDSFTKKLRELIGSSLLSKMALFSKQLASARSYKKWVEDYHSTIFSTPKKSKKGILAIDAIYTFLPKRSFRFS